MFRKPNMKRFKQFVLRDLSLLDSWLVSNGTMKMCGHTMSNESEKGSPAPLEQWGHCGPREHMREIARHFPGLVSINGPGYLLLKCSKH